MKAMENEGGIGMDDALSKKKPTYNYFFITLVVLIAVGAFSAIYFYGLIPANDIGNFEPAPLSESAVIWLTLDDKEYTIGETIRVGVRLTTNKQVSGSDVTLIYDPDKLELLSADPTVEESEGTALLKIVKLEPVFQNFPFARLERKGDMMYFSFSAITSAQETYRGNGEIAALKFKAVAIGDTSVEVLFNGVGNPDDTNVAFDGRDILNEARGVSFPIYANDES